MKIRRPPIPVRKRLLRKAARGFRGHPTGTLAFYGPDNTRASKMVASIVPGDDEQPAVMLKWYDDERDLRYASDKLTEVEDFFQAHGAVLYAILESIFGCPHEEGIDYEGKVRPKCLFWANRSRVTGETIQ